MERMKMTVKEDHARYIRVLRSLGPQKSVHLALADFPAIYFLGVGLMYSSHGFDWRKARDLYREFLGLGCHFCE